MESLSLTGDLLSSVATSRFYKSMLCDKLPKRPRKSASPLLTGYGLSTPLAALPNSL